jgi:hypothetical protein
MWRVLLRILGISVGGYGLLVAVIVKMIRPDSYAEVQELMLAALEAGAWLALAVVLCRTPPGGRGTSQWHLVTIIAAALVWIIVSGGLRWHLKHVYQLRSGQPFVGHEERLAPNRVTAQKLGCSPARSGCSSLLAPFHGAWPRSGHGPAVHGGFPSAQAVS